MSDKLTKARAETDSISLEIAFAQERGETPPASTWVKFGYLLAQERRIADEIIGKRKEAAR